MEIAQTQAAAMKIRVLQVVLHKEMEIDIATVAIVKYLATEL